MGLNSGQKSVYAEGYDVTSKLTFDLLDIKCHQFIINALRHYYYKTLVENYKLLHYGQVVFHEVT